MRWGPLGEHGANLSSRRRRARVVLGGRGVVLGGRRVVLGGGLGWEVATPAETKGVHLAIGSRGIVELACPCSSLWQFAVGECDEVLYGGGGEGEGGGGGTWGGGGGDGES